MEISSRAAQALKAVMVAFFATLISLLSHVLAGGAVPNPMSVLLPLSVSVLICIFLSGRKFSLIRLSAMVGFSQLLFHLMFVMGAGDGAHLVGAQAGHAHHALSMNMASAAASVDHAAMHGGWLMLVAHCLAAVATVLVLRRGESSLSAMQYIWHILSWRVIQLLLCVYTPRSPQPAQDHQFELLTLKSKLLGSSVARRGPPTLFAK